VNNAWGAYLTIFFVIRPRLPDRVGKPPRAPAALGVAIVALDGSGAHHVRHIALLRRWLRDPVP